MSRGVCIAQRYQLGGRLGRGGMGSVFQAYDRVTDRDVALKLLALDPGDPKAAQNAASFQREYYALAQLAHPRIIAVYEYGVHEGQPYYTMELLDGHDLRRLAPVPWRDACGLLRDVCSSLSILHSRRMVHRDVSARNVRCTSDGRAKLLDFGAMTPMGPMGEVVGTPPYMAPELLMAGDIDGRTDLYALGALAYWALTARDAYPARLIHDLAQVWKTTPPEPSVLVPGIPRELDDLVMSLMHMDVLARPQSATEVVDRLTAIAQLPPPEQRDLAQAYLTTPALVGCDAERERFQRHLGRAQRGHGGSVVIEASPGMGRSRLLGTLLIDAKLAGAIAVRVSAADQDGTPLGLLRAVGRAIEAALPERAALSRGTANLERAALLSVVLDDHAAPGKPIDPFSETTHGAFLSWLIKLSAERCIVLGVDDLERCDTASLAALARVCAHASGHAILLVGAVALRDDIARSRAVDQIVGASTRIPMRRLDERESHALVASVFGVVPNLEVVATWIFGLARGNPRMIMELSQFIVDRGLARFVDGSWALPESLKHQDLPGSLEQALEQRFLALSFAARRLLQLLSVVTPHAPLAVADYPRVLSGSLEEAQVFAAVEELVAAQMVVPQGRDYVLRERALNRIAERSVDEATARDLHRLLAALYAQRTGVEMVTNYHTARAGEWRAALDRMIVDALAMTDVAEPNAVFLRSDTGVRLIEDALLQAEQLGYPPPVAIVLRRSLVGIGAVVRPELIRHAEPLLARLRADSGLIYLDQTDAGAPALERILACLARAQATHQATPVEQRSLDPVAAIREIALLVSLLAGTYVRVLDCSELLLLPGMIEPLVPLSPAVAILHRVLGSVRDSIARGTEIGDARDAICAALARPIDGVDDVMRQGIHHVYSFYNGVYRATEGDLHALAIADELPQSGTHAALPWQIRALYFQHCGMHAEAEHCRMQMELLSLGHVEAETHLTVSLVYELGIAGMCADLMQVKRLWRRIQREAVTYPGWRPVERLAASMYSALRQDFVVAEVAAREGLSLVAPVAHLVWYPLVAALASVLVRTRRPEHALAVAQEAKAAVEAQGVRMVRGAFESLEVPLAFAEAAVGREPAAVARLDGLIAQLSPRAHNWVPLGVAHEARARLALTLDDRAGFDRHCSTVFSIYRSGGVPSLARRYAALIAHGKRALHETDVQSQVKPTTGADDSTSSSAVTIRRASS